MDISTADIQMIQRYLEAREKIHVSTDAIGSVTSLLSTFKLFSEDKIEVSPYALGCIHECIHLETYRILSALDEYISIIEAERKLDELRRFE